MRPRTFSAKIVKVSATQAGWSTYGPNCQVCSSCWLAGVQDVMAVIWEFGTQLSIPAAYSARMVNVSPLH